MDERRKLEAYHASLTQKLTLVSSLDSDILDLVSEVDEDLIEEEVVTADIWREDVGLLLRSIEDALKLPDEKHTMASGKSDSNNLTETSPDVSCDADGDAGSRTPVDSAPKLSTHVPDTGGHVPERVLSSSDVAQSDVRVFSNPSSDSVSDVMSVSSSSGQAHSKARALRVKLPKLELKRFGGNTLEWHQFWDVFDSLIHSSLELSDVDKFSYLRNILYGPAATVISGLSLTEVNYEAAVLSLKERYDNPQRIISAHMDALLNMKSVSDSHDLGALRRLCDGVYTHVRALGNLGRRTEHYGDMFAPILLNKIPKEIRLSVCKNVSEDSFSLDELLKNFSEELKSRERCEYVSAATEGKPTRTEVVRHGSSASHRNQPTAAALATMSGNAVQCVFCKETHASAACPTVTDVSKRKDILLTSHRCFICLRKNHIAVKCRSTKKCSKCGGLHHVTICEQKPGVSDSAGKGSTCMYNAAQTTALLQTAKAEVGRPSLPQSRVLARFLLDGGSQRTYITESLRQQLSLVTHHTESLAIQGFGSSPGTATSVEVVEFELVLAEGDLIVLFAIVVPVITTPVCHQYPADVAALHPRLANLQLADDCHGDASIDVLVGVDHYWKIVVGDVIKTDTNLVALWTRLGWVLSGQSEQIPLKSSTFTVSHLVTTHVLTCASVTSTLDQQLKNFWDLESLGILPSERSVYAEFKEQIEFSDNHYTVCLPWRESHPILPDNYMLSLKRLKSLTTRLERDPVVFTEYSHIMQDQLASGIIEEVPVGDLGEINAVHYIPHQAVIRHDKQTTKLRIVYDASASVGKCPSLNSCLHAGPSLLEHISDVLLRFRTHRIALTGDIEKAFLMMFVATEDRDVLRFLWWDQPTSPDRKVCVFRFTRVMFGLTPSPFLLNATLKHHLEQFRISDPAFVEQVNKSLYVDDLVAGADSADEAFALYCKVKSRLAQGGFNIRKFLSNSSEVQAGIAQHEAAGSASEAVDLASHTMEDDRSYAKVALNAPLDCSAELVKVLGVAWNRQADAFVMDISAVFSGMDKTATKRTVSAYTSRLYDPLGFVAPLTIRLKVFMQQLHVSGLDWDTHLSADQMKVWESLVSALQHAAPLHVPRCYLPVDDGNATLSLHGFCDASKDAFAAVVYLRSQAVDVQLAFVMAKTRVAPTDKQTIPRLELLAALILARLMKSVSTALDGFIRISSLCCWSDSRVALGWISGEQREWKQFVQNRVTEIRHLVPAELWHFCPGVLNPADIPSRGSSPDELCNSVWLTGPAWLKTSEQPPVQKATEGESAEVLAECTRELKKVQPQSAVNVVTAKDENLIGQLIDCKTYSSYQRLLRVTAYVLKFVRLLRRSENVKMGSLVDEAEILWVKDIQQTSPVSARLEKSKTQLGIFVDDQGVSRCIGRLQSTDLSFSQRHPALLLPHHVTELIVHYCHDRVFHNGVVQTLAEVRSKFWICRGRQFVKLLLRRCRLCRLLESKPYRTPSTAPLPAFRTKMCHPFQHIGVDFAGPFYLEDATTKSYMVLYTCAVTRAVHLDLVMDLTTEVFLRSFRRFAARRGTPTIVWSDNGKTFKAAAKLLKKLATAPDVTAHLASQRINWNFNIEKAPWWGGFFERLIKSVKRCLRKVLLSSRLCRDELFTLLIDIEATLNSRPLTYVSTEDLLEPLTPSHLLCGRRLRSLPDSVCRDLESVDLRSRLEHMHRLLAHFWKRWQQEYLLELRSQHRVSADASTSDSTVQAGDVVVIHEDGIQRGLWKLGVVDTLLPGRDGVVRGAKVRTTSKGGRISTKNRPLQKLYPVEEHSLEQPASSSGSRVEDEAATAAPSAPASTDKAPEVQAADGDAGPPAAVSRAQPRRAAAQRADKNRQVMLSANQL